MGGGESASCQMDRGYYGPTDRKNGYMGLVDLGLIIITSTISHACVSSMSPITSPCAVSFLVDISFWGLDAR